ncbi:hypothetical protein CHU98_g12086 [Xylaria longipes]|nr:hypothetical protein CHU98_g12086 [Xylaria longipes]
MIKLKHRVSNHAESDVRARQQASMRKAGCLTRLEKRLAKHNKRGNASHNLNKHPSASKRTTTLSHTQETDACAADADPEQGVRRIERHISNDLASSQSVKTHKTRSRPEN